MLRYCLVFVFLLAGCTGREASVPLSGPLLCVSADGTEVYGNPGGFGLVTVSSQGLTRVVGRRIPGPYAAVHPAGGELLVLSRAGLLWRVGDGGTRLLAEGIDPVARLVVYGSGVLLMEPDRVRRLLSSGKPAHGADLSAGQEHPSAGSEHV